MPQAIGRFVAAKTTAVLLHTLCARPPTKKEGTVPHKQVSSREELAELEASILKSAELTCLNLATLCSRQKGLTAFRKLKFEDAGWDPLDSERPLNFVEQLNQTFSNLVALKATEHLLEHHPDAVPFTLRLGPIRGFDVESGDGTVVAEVFAAVTYDSNDKLAKDTKKVAGSGAVHKYVFYYAAKGPRPNDTVKGVRRIPLAL